MGGDLNDMSKLTADTLWLCVVSVVCVVLALFFMCAPLWLKLVW